MTDNPTPIVGGATSATGDQGSSPAENAATVREALDVLYHYTSYQSNPPGNGRSETWAEGLAAVRALLAKAEAGAEEVQRIVSVLPGLPHGRTPLEYAKDVVLKADCGGVNCGKCQQCLTVHEFFLKDAVKHLEADRDAAVRERDRAREALRGVAWKDTAGLCWCPGETEFAVAHPGGEHTPQCLAARAALTGEGTG